MISFRYHIVSIVAVFLALALGIVIGTTALNGPITTDLRHQVDGLKSDRTALAKQVKTLNNRVDDSDQFASVYGQRLIAKTLKGQSVLVLAMPNADSSIQDKITRDLSSAGATVTGRLELTGDYIDQRRGSDIVSLATGSSRPSGLNNLPVTSDPGQLGGALLAFALLGLGAPTDSTTIYAALTQLHMLSVSGKTPQPAKTVVIVAGGAMAGGSYASNSELALATALQRGGGRVVVAGDSASATQAGLVAAVRNSSATKTTISTVDNTDTAIGQITTVLTTVDTIDSQIGQYGTGAGAQALFPEIN